MKNEIKDYSFNKNYCKIAEQTADWAVANGRESQVLFYAKLKRAYRNGYIYKPESRYKEFGRNMSKTTYRRRIAQLVSMGWAIRNNGGISLISADKLPVTKAEKKKRFIYLDNDDTLTVTLLRNLICVISQRNQECKLKLSKAQTPKSTMLLNINGALTKTLHSYNEDVFLSVKTMAKKMNRSKSTVLRQLSKARKLGIIKTYSRYILEPNAVDNYKLFEGQKYKRIANQISTSFNFKLKWRIDLSALDKTDRIIAFYCNDCF